MRGGDGGMWGGAMRRVWRICLIMFVMGAFISLRMGRGVIRCEFFILGLGGKKGREMGRCELMLIEVQQGVYLVWRTTDGARGTV